MPWPGRVGGDGLGVIDVAVGLAFGGTHDDHGTRSGRRPIRPCRRRRSARPARRHEHQKRRDEEGRPRPATRGFGQCSASGAPGDRRSALGPASATGRTGWALDSPAAMPRWSRGPWPHGTTGVWQHGDLTASQRPMGRPRVPGTSRSDRVLGTVGWHLPDHTLRGHRRPARRRSRRTARPLAAPAADVPAEPDVPAVERAPTAEREDGAAILAAVTAAEAPAATTDVGRAGRHRDERRHPGRRRG